MQNTDVIIDLNSDLFPLDYSGPYPITRGIRVEIAAIILIFLFGVISQMKVWKIVKKRREERAVEQVRKEEERNRAEEALGRRIEAGNNQEQSMWDAVYGDKAKLKESNVDSGIGTEAPSTTGKSSMSIDDVHEVHDGGMEMQVFGGSRFGARDGGRITIHVAQDDEVSEAPKALPQSSAEIGAKTSREPSIEEPLAGSAKSVISESASTKSKGFAAIDPSMTLKPKSKQPKFVPLPFTVPDKGEKDSRRASDASSLATFAASEHLPERSSKRFSGSELMRKLSGRSQNHPVASGTSQEALMIPHAEDDRSSVAATVDGVSDHVDPESGTSSSRAPSPEKTPSPDEKMVTAPQTPVVPISSKKPLDSGLQTQQGGYFSATVPVPRNSEPHTVLDASSETNGAEPAITADVSQPLARQSSLIVGSLPHGGASKVVNAYRTNEWAKHLDRADVPSVDDLKIQKITAAEGEKAAPVNVQALSQTPLTADPAPNLVKGTGDKAQLPSSRSRSSSAGQPTNPYRAQQTPRSSRVNSGGSAVISNMERNPSQTSLTSSSSSSSALPLPKGRSSTTSLVAPRAFRTSSMPLIGSPLAESPIEEGIETSFTNSRFTPSTSHLMSQRESILRSKPSSTSLLRMGSGTSINRISSAPNTTSGSTMAMDTLDEDDNMSLSQRKSMLQQQSLSRSSSGDTTPYSASRTSLNSNNPYGQTARLPTASNLQMNSNPPHTARPHLPAASSSNAAISTWRASLAQVPRPEVQQQHELETRRRELLAEKKAVRNSRASEQRSREQRESVLGREMRRGSMMDAHRAAMRKMQAGVNENLRTPGT